MKRIFIFFLSLVIIINPIVSFSEDAEKQDPKETTDLDAKEENQLDIFAEGAILMDLNSSQILYEKNANAKLYPASTTKIMTAILAIELGNLEDTVTVDKEVTDLTSGSHIALDIGEQMTLKQMLYALLIESANDSALAIAKHISGNIDVFVDLMNKKAEELGAQNTNFVNPNGLHDDNHYSSAHDLALIARYAMKNDTFRSIVKEYMYNIPPTNKKSDTRYLKSANKLIYSTKKITVDGENVPIKYDGAIGVKTGFTTIAQSCLVSVVEKDDRALVAVVLKSNGENLYVDTHKLLNYGFDQFANFNLGFKNQYIKNFTIKQGVAPFVAGVLKYSISSNIVSEAAKDVKTKVTPIKDLTAPIKTGDKVGEITYSLNDKVIAKADVVSSSDIARDPNLTWHKRLLDKWYIFVFILLFINRVNYMKRRAKSKRRKKIKSTRTTKNKK